jgi:hypothetical protein
MWVGHPVAPCGTAPQHRRDARCWLRAQELPGRAASASRLAHLQPEQMPRYAFLAVRQPLHRVSLGEPPYHAAARGVVLNISTHYPLELEPVG